MQTERYIFFEAVALTLKITIYALFTKFQKYRTTGMALVV